MTTSMMSSIGRSAIFKTSKHPNQNHKKKVTSMFKFKYLISYKFRVLTLLKMIV